MLDKGVRVHSTSGHTTGADAIWAGWKDAEGPETRDACYCHTLSTSGQLYLNCMSTRKNIFLNISGRWQMGKLLIEISWHAQKENGSFLAPKLDNFDVKH